MCLNSVSLQQTRHIFTVKIGDWGLQWNMPSISRFYNTHGIGHVTWSAMKLFINIGALYLVQCLISYIPFDTVVVYFVHLTLPRKCNSCWRWCEVITKKRRRKYQLVNVPFIATRYVIQEIRSMERVSAQCCCIPYTVIKIFDCNCNDLELGRFNVIKGQRLWCQSIAHGRFPIWPPLNPTSYIKDIFYRSNGKD